MGVFFDGGIMISMKVRSTIPTDTTGLASTLRRVRLVDVYLAEPEGRIDANCRVTVNNQPIGRGDFIPPGADIYVEDDLKVLFHIRRCFSLKKTDGLLGYKH